MKKLILALFIILFLTSTVFAESLVIRKVSAGGKNYTKDANCMGAWFMDDSTTEIDETTNGNDLTVSAGDTIPTSATVPTGYSGTSRDFEQDDLEYLTIGDGTELDIYGADAKISMVAWIRVEEVANDEWLTFVNKFGSGAYEAQYEIAVVGTGTNTFKIGCALSSDGESATFAYSTSTNLATGTWYHVACVSNDIDIRIYVNGSLNCTPGSHTAGIWNGADPFYVGANVDYSEYYDGLLDEVAVFNRELSSTEVNEIYTYGISGNKGGSD